MSRPLRDFSRSLPMALLRAREAVMARFRPLLRQHRVTEQQWRVLRVLAEHGCCDGATLAQASCIHPASLSRILRALEARRLIRSRTSRSDSRRIDVVLTDDGHDTFTRLAAETESIYRQIEAEVGAEDLQRALASIRRLTRVLT